MRARIEKRADKRFKKLDRNGDGVIDRGEWTRKAKAFDRFDRDHDGTLSPDEFRRLALKRARHR
jgi:Ca2+-binding EF-hand superfamily protein